MQPRRVVAQEGNPKGSLEIFFPAKRWPDGAEEVKHVSGQDTHKVGPGCLKGLLLQEGKHSYIYIVIVEMYIYKQQAC